jgi:hypothetical protein
LHLMIVIVIYAISVGFSYWKKGGRKDGFKLFGVYAVSGVALYLLHLGAMSILAALWLIFSWESFSWVLFNAVSDVCFLILGIFWARLVVWGQPILGILRIGLSSE